MIVPEFLHSRKKTNSIKSVQTFVVNRCFNMTYMSTWISEKRTDTWSKKPRKNFFKMCASTARGTESFLETEQHKRAELVFDHGFIIIAPLSSSAWHRGTECPLWFVSWVGLTLIWAFPEADRPQSWFPNANAEWWNISSLIQGHPVLLCAL